MTSGADVAVIRDYLGHASATKSRYIANNLMMKRDALQTSGNMAI
nr:hypothetical protein [Mesorhizobium amorphae]